LPDRVGYLHQVGNIDIIKATGEVAAGCRVRNALGAQPVKEGFIIAAKFDVLQPHSIEQRVVGQIQNVVALVIGKVFLEQMQARVDLLAQPKLVDHQMDRADAPAVYRPALVSHLIADIARLHDWLGLIAPGTLRIQTALNSALAIA
jgi:hypothetical protein